MGIRTVRLDEEAESRLADLRNRTGLSISEVLKRGLDTYAEAVRNTTPESPYEVYRRLDLGSGGEARAPAARAKADVVHTIREKHGR